jgi:hypothetical protein
MLGETAVANDTPFVERCATTHESIAQVNEHAQERPECCSLYSGVVLIRRYISAVYEYSV